MKEIGIYIHIPFCAKKCLYCDFISYANLENKMDAYQKALETEIQETAKDSSLQDFLVTTIYIGGGTPSYIPSSNIISILQILQQHYQIAKDAEITIEINPGTVTKAKLEAYKKSGINRISIGLQTTDDHLLKKIGRIHTYEQFLETYTLARKLGFQNINIDLILALPTQTMEILDSTLEKAIKLNPEHLSVYSLILEPETPLYNLVEQQKLSLPQDETERQMYWYAKNTLQQNGYHHYEISNFSKPGYASKHNQNCWEQKPYLGFGLASHSYHNQTRYSNTTNLDQYIQATKKGPKALKATQTIHEIQTKQDQQKEYILLGLRKIEGISISTYKNKFIHNPIYQFRKELDKLVKEGLLEIGGDNIKLTSKGIDFANIVWQEFI